MIVHVITGGRNAGKTTTVKRLATLLREHDVAIAGFYTDTRGDDRMLVPVTDAPSRYFGTHNEGDTDGLTVGRFTIDPAAFKYGYDLAIEPGDVLLIDEIGRLERQKRGFYPILTSIDYSSYIATVFVTREGVEDIVFDAVPDTIDRRCHEVSPDTIDNVVDRISQSIIGEEST